MSFDWQISPSGSQKDLYCGTTYLLHSVVMAVLIQLQQLLKGLSPEEVQMSMGLCN